MKILCYHSSLSAGEGNEEISNMIHNYIKEIEDLRYLCNMSLNHFCLKQILVMSAAECSTGCCAKFDTVVLW